MLLPRLPALARDTPSPTLSSPARGEGISPGKEAKHQFLEQTTQPE
jgi:hypothetical protein